jgi:putative transposase
LGHIKPGKPQQNVYMERFNRTERYEWISQYEWQTRDDDMQLPATQWM